MSERDRLIAIMQAGIDAREAEIKAKWSAQGHMHTGHSELHEAALAALEAAGMRVVPVETLRVINRRASPDPTRTFNDAIRDLEHITAHVRSILAAQEDSTSE